MRRRVGVAALAAALAFGCAAETARRPEERRPSPHDAEGLGAIDQADTAQRRAYDQLLATRAATTPDCPRACQLADTVCTLAERICSIAAQDPADDPVARRCADARARCARARAAVAGPVAGNRPPSSGSHTPGHGTCAGMVGSVK